MLWSKCCGQNGFYKMTSVGTQMWHIEALGLKCDYVCLSPVVTKVVCWTGVQSMQMLVAGISNLAWTAVVWPPPSLLSNFFYWQKQPCTVDIVKIVDQGDFSDVTLVGEDGKEKSPPQLQILTLSQNWKSLFWTSGFSKGYGVLYQLVPKPSKKKGKNL